MKQRDLIRIDALDLVFEAEGDPTGEGGDGLVGFLEALEAHAGGWMPTFAKGKRKRRYSRESFRKAVEEAKLDLDLLSLDRPASPEVSISMSLGTRSREWRAWLKILPFSFFEEPGAVEERSQALIALVRAWASRYPPRTAKAHSKHDSTLAFLQDQEAKVDREQVSQMYWLNVLSRTNVEALGRERVLSTPAQLVEELPTGAVLLVTRPTIADCTSEPARIAQAKALVHLRPELSFDAVLAKLRERSAALVPVPPRFHPDVAELLEEISYDCYAGQRQLKIAELNAWQPPKVSEWLPRESAPGPDVPDPARAIARYVDDSEGIEIRFQDKVPSVSQYTPESLVALDIYLWTENLPYHQEREFLDDSFGIWLGAYLGKVMVRHLGGEWVPRKNLLEAQVRVGERAWLPFLRVRHSLQTKQSLVDYSLAQFYRTAERHLRQSQQR